MVERVPIEIPETDVHAEYLKRKREHDHLSGETSVVAPVTANH